jgi:putative heme-binding domain-containing protein
VANRTLSVEQRRSALRALIDNRAPGLAETCAGVLTIPGLSVTAADGLALESDPAIADRIVQHWAEINAHERPAVLSTILSRRSWAERILEAVAEKQIPRTDLSTFHARQIRGFKDAPLDRRLTEVWGATRDSADDSLARIEHWKKRLTPESLKEADLNRGRAVFKAACSSCHVLNNEGSRVGPELTGSARDNLDYLLQNIVDPSAAVAREYQMVTFTMKDGRALSGVTRRRDSRTVVLQTLAETISLLASDIEETQESTLSMMPDGLLDALPEADARALIAYLMRK